MQVEDQINDPRASYLPSSIFNLPFIKKDFMATLIPDHFFDTPGLWIGLALAVVFLFAAVRLRRYRGPI